MVLTLVTKTGCDLRLVHTSSRKIDEHEDGTEVDYRNWFATCAC